MFNSSMGIEGTFWYYGGVTLIGTIFVGVFIKETKGLTNAEKKTLYTPVKKQESVELEDKKKEIAPEFKSTQ